MELKGQVALSRSSLGRSSSKFSSIAKSTSTLKATSSPQSLSSVRIMASRQSNSTPTQQQQQQNQQQHPRESRPCIDYCFVANCFCYDGCVATPIYPELTNQLYQVQGATAQNKRKTFCQQFKSNGFFYLTISVMIVCNVAFLIVDARYLIQEIHLAVVIISQILFLVTFLALFATACTDPGILPRATEDEVHKTESEFHPTDGTGYVRTRDIMIYGQGLKLKYCWTCRFFRPPRASHCSICNHCVDKFDHHCPWIGNCVGRRNYRSFFLFLMSLSALGVYISACLISHLVLLTRKMPIGKAISSTPMTMVLLILVLLAIWSVLGLSGFHCYLVLSNITTNEDIKSTFVAKRFIGKGEVIENPFTQGSVCKNCCHNLCSSRRTSLIRHV